MPQKQLAAEPCFVLRLRSYKETQFLTDLYTVSCGRLTAVTRFPKAERRRLLGVLQPYQILKADLTKGRGSLWTLSSVFPDGPFRSLSLEHKICADYVNELFYYLVREEESCAPLFVAYAKTLERLTRADSDAAVQAALRSFERSLLDDLGYGVGGYDRDGIELRPGVCYRFLPEEGFVRLEVLDAAAYARRTAGVYLGDSLIEICQNEEAPAFLKEQKALYGQIISYLLQGRELKSRALYRAYLEQAAPQPHE